MSLKKLLKRLKAFLHKNQIIPHAFASDELIIRAIFAPLFFSISKQKLNSKSFLPPIRNNDPEQLSLVSVFRRDYSTDDKCKDIAVQIKMHNQLYVGFLSFLPKHIQETNDTQGMLTKAEMVYSPIDKSNNYRRPVAGNTFYVTDAGLPMHAEIKFANPIEPDNPNTGHRLYAETLLEIVKQSMHVDKFPDQKGWLQHKIIFISK